MPQICNFCSPTQTTLQLSLTNGPGFIYDRSQADYLNWIPVDFQLDLITEKITFLEKPTLSFESIKLLMACLSGLLYERKEIAPDQDSNYPFKVYNFGATEGEFSLSFQNLFDHNEKDLVSVTVWINMAYCSRYGEGIEKGVRFCAYFDEVKQFYDDLLLQFKELIARSDYGYPFNSAGQKIQQLRPDVPADGGQSHGG